MAPVPVCKPQPRDANRSKGVSLGTLTRLALFTMAKFEKELWPKKLLNRDCPSGIDRALDPSDLLPPKLSGSILEQ